MGDEMSRALAVAVEAAREAGALIRADFHRPGGPRGAGDHAEVDTEAELLIRARLRTAFPAWSYLGEETGTDGPEGAPARWIVDPNDGTRAYLRGWRGSAVSIGLVRDGLPVLGVVYAPLAPDDGGDLIAWAEGGTLTRNGVPMTRTIPAQLGPRDIVVVSQAADGSPIANARACAPARYRPLPSIAYRLALVAAGDAEAAVSLNGPGDWDFAGGHALLRAAGGELVNERGEPVRYPANRRVTTRWCFGGHLDAARTLARRSWGEALARTEPHGIEAAYPLAYPRRATAVTDAGMLARAQNCLLGQAAGDALGSLVEFRSAARIADEYPSGVRDMADGGHFDTIAGQPTDDTEMALMLARSILIEGTYRPQAALTAYRAWRDSHPFDMGTTTSVGLAGHPNGSSEANGSLMRISPLAVWAHALTPEQVAEHAGADARLTHPNPVPAEATAAFAVAVAHAVATGDGPRGAYAAAVAWAESTDAAPSVRAALRAAETALPEGFDSDKMGWVLIALQNAFYQLLHAPSLEEGIVRTIGHGGDTDTTAAIAGALLGAVHGRDAVPPAWQRAVLTCRAIAGLEGVRQPRPRPFWPVDLMEMAELLLALGRDAAG